MVMSSEQPSTVTSSDEAVNSEVAPEETPVTSEEVIVPLETGTDGTELFVKQNLQTLEIFHNDKKWVFTYKDLSWAEKYKCVDAAQIWKDGEFSFSLASYYVAALVAMIVDSPVRPFTDTTLGQLDASVVAQLITIAPTPADPEIPAAAKKALGQGETG